MRECKKRFVRETIQARLDQLVAEQTDGSGELTAVRQRGTRSARVKFIIREEDSRGYIVELLSVVVEGFWEPY